MTLETLRPTPTWDAESYPATVEVFEALAEDESVEIRVWGADWCGDCRSLLPDFGAAIEAVAFPEDRLHVHPVDQDKDGELTGEYGVEFIPTIVVEREGEELVRFVEEEPLPPARYLAEELQDAGVV